MLSGSEGLSLGVTHRGHLPFPASDRLWHMLQFGSELILIREINYHSVQGFMVLGDLPMYEGTFAGPLLGPASSLV